MSEGWISIHRKIRDNYLFKEKRVFSKFEAWIDLLLEVNHQDNKFILGNELVEVKKGSTITSIRQLCEKWGWSNTKVKKFFELLEQDEMITYKSDAKKTLVSIVNYAFYQPKEKEKRHENDTETTRSNHENDTKTTRKHTNNNVNNDNNENNEKKENNKEKYIYVFNNPATDFEKAFTDFENFRIEMGKPMTDKAKKLTLDKLDKLAKTDAEKIEILNQSIMLNWSGVFEIKGKSKTTETSGDDKKWSMWD